MQGSSRLSAAALHMEAWHTCQIEGCAGLPNHPIQGSLVTDQRTLQLELTVHISK